MRALVLGATGFIGGQIARTLAAHGHTVRALRRSTSPMLALEDVPAEIVVGDMQHPSSLQAAMRGIDIVFHAAGYYPPNSLAPRAAVRQAAAGMRAVLQAAQTTGVQRIIYTSSLSTIGPAPRGRSLANEHDAYLPGSVAASYFDAKWAMEHEAYRAVAAGQDIVILCPTVVFGPGDVKPTSGIALLGLVRGLMPVYIEGALNVVDVRDLAEAHVAAADHGRNGERYIIGGHNTTVSELVRHTAQIAHIQPPRLRLPANIAMLAGRVGEVAALAIPGRPLLPLSEAIDMIRHGQHYDIGKAQRELGLSTRPLTQTIEDTLTWFRTHGYMR